MPDTADDLQGSKMKTQDAYQFQCLFPTPQFNSNLKIIYPNQNKIDLSPSKERKLKAKNETISNFFIK